MPSKFYHVAAVRSRADGRMYICEVPENGTINTGDIALFGVGESVEEGFCIHSSTLVDETTMRFIETVSGFRNPLPVLHGRMVPEYFDSVHKKEA